jgi:phosphoenolpyruvate synthase/pyruvate phosphate dikinase
MSSEPVTSVLPRFDRDFLGSAFHFTQMGSGRLGGKAEGLVRMRGILDGSREGGLAAGVDLGVPRMAVIATDHFDAFMEENALARIAYSGESDARIGGAFQRASLPVGLAGDLRALVQQVHVPLAVRSSSLLEDAIHQPFAGVYGTKMIPNNLPDPDARFRKLSEAVKFVYASTFFSEASDYARAAGRAPAEEKMAVILQEIVGRRRGTGS